jgi:Fibronectin type III domain
LTLHFARFWRHEKNDLGLESMNRKFPVFALPLIMACTMVGCGAPAAPAPPSLNLPTPAVNLSAVRIGDSVHLAWTMPTRTTDHLPLRHPVTARICRAVDGDACTNVGTLSLAPGAAGTYADVLPSDLSHKPERPLRYEVALQNHAGKSAGPSNPAYGAAGNSPAAVTGLTGQLRQDGVLLSWKPVPEPGHSILFRIERLQLTVPASQEARSSPLAPSPPSPTQTLVVHGRDGEDPGHAIDTSALFNQRYRYVVERVASFDFSGRSVEVQGAPSEAIEVTTTDVFPPAVPQGLVAVADSTAGAIDLSWTPDGDSDLAAYRVYRRDVQGGLPAQRVASVGVETSFRDTGVQPEHTYAYSVSAVDQSGNESKRSPEVEETLPRR